MTAKSYAVEYRRQGPAGLQEILARVYNASTTDTVSFGADFTRIETAAIVQRSNALIQISVLAASLVSGNYICLPTGASLAGDDLDLFVVGPANASVG